MTQLSFKQSFELAWGRLSKGQKAFATIAFLASLGFTINGLLPTIQAGDYTVLNVLSMIMSIFGFLGTWTLAIQWQHTFKLNGVQNVSGIMVAGIQGIYGDMITSFYYLVTEFIGHFSWNKRRADDGELVVDKHFGWKDIAYAIFFWTIGLGVLSWLIGGKQIILDALTNGLAFTAQQRQVKGHLDGYYLWLLVDILSFILFLRVGNEIVAFSYLAMLMQGFVGIMIWKNGLGEDEKNN